MPDMANMAEVWKIRLGVDAFVCKEGYFLAGFESPLDSMVFSEAIRRQPNMFSDIRTASIEDFLYERSQGALVASFGSTPYESKVYVVLSEETRSRCSDEEMALRYIAIQMCVGWLVIPLIFQ